MLYLQWKTNSNLTLCSFYHVVLLADYVLTAYLPVRLCRSSGGHQHFMKQDWRQIVHGEGVDTITGTPVECNNFCWFNSLIFSSFSLWCYCVGQHYNVCCTFSLCKNLIFFYYYTGGILCWYYISLNLNIFVSKTDKFDTKKNYPFILCFIQNVSLGLNGFLKQHLET